MGGGRRGRDCCRASGGGLIEGVEEGVIEEVEENVDEYVEEV